MNAQVCKIFYISLLLNSLVAKAPLVCVGFSGKQLLDGSVQGKKCKTEISKFEDQVVEKVEALRVVVAVQEQTMKKLRQEVTKKRELFELKHKDLKKNDPIFIKEKEELSKQIHDLNNKERELEKAQQLFMSDVQQASNLIKKKYDTITKLFYKDVATRYGPMRGWDIVFEKNNKDVASYISGHSDKTEELLQLLNKQVCAQGKVYQTKPDVKRLFEDLGIIHLENNKIDSSICGDLDARKTAYYRNNKALLDQYKIKYASCVAQHYRAPFYIKWISEKVGFGVFASADIKAGELVQEYTGILRVPSKHKGLFADDTTYSWNYPAVGNYAAALHLDSKFEGNEMRFVNHGNDPNAVQITIIGADNLFHVCYIASRNIKTGEQILVSYGKDYWACRNYYEDLF
ncbi:MAG: SET domain-containing protein-lysine N-methyltransferase [Candidatus Babeliales bacterium]|jgi:hypothetical protein